MHSDDFLRTALYQLNHRQVTVYRNSLKWLLTSYQSCLEKGASELKSPLLRVENGSTNYQVPTFYGFLMSFLLCSYILSVFIFLVFGWNFWIPVSSSQVQPRLWHKGNVIRWPRHKYFCDVFSSGLLNSMQISPLTRTNLPKHSTSVKYCYKQFYSIMIKRCCCCCCCCFVFAFVLLFRLFHPFFPMLSSSDACT